MSKSRHLQRGIYLLPTLFTLGNLFCGYSSLLQSIRGNLDQAAMLIVVAAILDGLDGRIARLTGSQSPFGLEFDSMADLVSFGVGPALLYYHWTLRPVGHVGWLVAFLYLVCAATRLARFNIRSGVGSDKRYFVGLPSPVAGSWVACVTFGLPWFPESAWLALLLTLVVFCVALLMLSRLRYRSFKEFDLRNRRSYVYVLPVALSLVAIAYHPKLTLLLLLTIYVLSAPGHQLWVVLAKGRAVRARAVEGRETEVVDEPALR